MLALQTNKQHHNSNDGRPRFAIGHISITADDVGELADFYTTIGMRHIVNMGRMAIVELAGGTHIVIQKGAAGVSSLDLMVNKIDDTRNVMEAAGAQPSGIRRGNPHDSFTAVDPEGNHLVVHSSHSMGIV